MADARETFVEAVRDALEAASVTLNSEVTTKPTGLSVDRFLASLRDDAMLPHITVLYGGERPTPMGQGPTDVSERNVVLELAVRVRADADQSPDAALFPVMAWAELVMTAGYPIGGSVNTEAPEIERVVASEQADAYAMATLRFPVTLQTKWGDPRQDP